MCKMTTKDALIIRISSQIKEEQEYGKTLEEGKLLLTKTKYWVPVPIAVFLIWVVACVVHGISPLDILMMWIVASFFFYMFYFFLMIPSLGSCSAGYLPNTKSISRSASSCGSQTS